MASSRAKYTPPKVPLPIGSRIVTCADDGKIRRSMDVEEKDDADAIDKDAESEVREE